jgi:hypothetical protein
MFMRRAGQTGALPDPALGCSAWRVAAWRARAVHGPMAAVAPQQRGERGQRIARRRRQFAAVRQPSMDGAARRRCGFLRPYCHFLWRRLALGLTPTPPVGLMCSVIEVLDQ